MARHSTRNRLKCGVLQLTSRYGKVLHLPLTRDLPAMLAALDVRPALAKSYRPVRKITILAR